MGKIKYLSFKVFYTNILNVNFICAEGKMCFSGYGTNLRIKWLSDLNKVIEKDISELFIYICLQTNSSPDKDMSKRQD